MAISCCRSSLNSFLWQAGYCKDADLLPNGQFDRPDQILGWTQFSVGREALGWTSDDADGMPGSGSIEIKYGGGEGAGIQSACFSVVGGAAYIFGGRVKAIKPSNQGYGMTCLMFESNDCTGTFESADAPSPNYWSQLQSWLDIGTETDVLSAGANSVMCRALLFNVVPADTVGATKSDATDITVRFDDLFFRSAPPDKLFGDGFES